MLTVFITSNQTPLPVYAVFCHNIIITCTLYTSGARHDVHAVPSNINKIRVWKQSVACMT